MGLFENISSINWELESYPLPQDFVFLPLFAFCFPSVRLFLDRYVFEGISKRLMFGEGYASVNLKTDDKQKKIIKFKESAWKCVYFFSAEFLALCLTYNEPWFTNTRYFWEGPGNQAWPDQKIKLKLKGLYMYSGGFYLYSSFALVFWETRRSDFSVSMAHHIATSLLIVLSYTFRFARVGSVILALHEGSDVLLEVAKMSKYCGCEWLASFFFVSFVLSWTILRLVFYPFWILWSTSYEVVLTLDEQKKADASLYYYLFNTLLFCLLVCHIYWWVLMLRMLRKQIQARGQISDDVRSGNNTFFFDDSDSNKDKHMYGS